MTEHTIEQGESILSLAFQYGLFPNTIWNHPANTELKNKRKNMNILLPGDVVTIPDKQLKEYDKPTDKKHKFRRKGTPALFRLQVFDHEKPRANQSYTLIIDGTIYDGKTNGEGVLQHHIAPDARSGELTIGEDRQVILLSFGHLDPLSEITGIQKRLGNLGFDCGEPSEELNDATREALRLFQKRFNLPVTGEADKATTDKLAEMHDKQSDFPENRPTAQGGN